MSFRALDWAMQVDVDNVAERAVLTCLAWHMNDKTGRCDPSIFGIKDRTKVGIRQVRDALKTLEEKRLINRIQIAGSRTVFVLNVVDTTTQSGTPVQSDTPVQSVRTPLSDRNGDPCPIGYPNKERTRKEQGINIYGDSTDLLGDPVLKFKKVKNWYDDVPYQEIVETYNSIPGVVTCQEVNAKRKQLIKARYQEQIKRCKATNRDEGIEVMGYFFRRVRESDFLCGRITPKNGSAPFRKPIDWFFNRDNFLKIMEDVYANRLPKQQ